MTAQHQHERARAVGLIDVIHDGQTRMDGSPYRWHPIWVMAQVAVWGGTHLQQLAAVFHDGPEDNEEWPTERIIEEGQFPQEIEPMLYLLNKHNFSDKVTNILAICESPEALLIKLADNKHNNNFLVGQTVKDARMEFYDWARDTMLTKLYEHSPGFDYKKTPSPRMVADLSRTAIRYSQPLVLSEV